MEKLIRNNILHKHKSKTYVTYKGLILYATNSARNELLHYGFMLEDCKKILEKGYEVRKRSKGTEEKWLDCGNKTYNIVIVKAYSAQFEEEIYLIKHIGRFTKRK
tara:strand:+ start:5524 stop:5838 length:315 start_codon:yes stop_codon:yes gene_type:complete